MRAMRIRGGMVRGGSWVALGLLFGAMQASAVPSNVASWRRNGTNTQTLGFSVGTAGDFNCDGIADLAIGAPWASTTPTGATLAYRQGWVGVWFGDGTLPSQPSEPPDWFVTGNGAAAPAESELGWVMNSGDVNGDGCDDLLVGNRATPAGTPANVRAYFGAVGGPDTNFDWRRTIPGFGAPLSFGVDNRGDIATGDVNGDGTDDIIVGIPDATFGQAEEGAVFVWLGGPGLASVPDGPADPIWIAESNQAGARLGYSVASGGDVDNDGREDIVAGGPGWNGSIPNSTDTGIAVMWKGSSSIQTDPDGTVVGAPWSLQIGSPSAQLGSSVAIAGDVDGDGFDDILAGAPFYDNPNTAGTGEGTVLVTRGASPAPGTDVFSWTHFGQVKGWLGWSVAAAGDTNGDGLADYLMGEPRDNSDPTLFGRAHLVLGRATAAWGPNPATDVLFTESGIPGTPHAEWFGISVSTIGDWNDDGLSDIVVGAPGIDNTGAVFSLDGVAFVYLGRDDANPLALLNGWTVYPGTRIPAAELIDGIVHFRGGLWNGAEGVPVFRLPASMRPATQVYVAADLFLGAPGRLLIYPDGFVYVQSATTFADARSFTSLEGVKFAPSATGFTPLTPAAGWLGAEYGTSNPAVAKINGIVHLKGTLTYGTDYQLFTLPVGMRPATDVYLSIGLCNAIKGRLYIQPSGLTQVFTVGPFSDATCFTSLDGVSFAPKPDGFAPANLVNGWLGAPFSTSGAAATIIRNVVHLKGAIGSGTTNQAFTLPPLLRPEAYVYLPLDLCGGVKGRLIIDPAGTVNVLAYESFSSAQCFTSLDGVTYTTVPEPVGAAALLSGVLALVGLRRANARTLRRRVHGR